MSNVPLLFIDTNIFIYHFQGHEEFGQRAKSVFELLVQDKVRAVTSIITQVELLSVSISDQEVQQLLALFLETPNLEIKELGAKEAIEAARIRRTYHFSTPDCIQLATALCSRADQFITNDKGLTRFTELDVTVL